MAMTRRRTAGMGRSYGTPVLKRAHLVGRDQHFTIVRRPGELHAVCDDARLEGDVGADAAVVPHHAVAQGPLDDGARADDVLAAHLARGGEVAARRPDVVPRRVVDNGGDGLAAL